MPILGCSRGTLRLSGKCDFPGKVWLPGKMTSQEICHTGKWKFPGNVSSQEMWLPGKWDFLGNVLLPSKSGKSVNSREMLLPGKCDFLGNVTSREMWLPGICDFLGNATSWEIILPGKSIFFVKVAFQTKLISENNDKYGIMQIFGHLDKNTFNTCDKCDHSARVHTWQGTAQILTTLATSPQVH